MLRNVLSSTFNFKLRRILISLALYLKRYMLKSTFKLGIKILIYFVYTQNYYFVFYGIRNGYYSKNFKF